MDKDYEIEKQNCNKMRESDEQPDQKDEPGERSDSARVCGASDRSEDPEGDGRTGQGKDHRDYGDQREDDHKRDPVPCTGKRGEEGYYQPHRSKYVKRDYLGVCTFYGQEGTTGRGLCLHRGG